MQVRFSKGQGKIIKDVMAGRIDIGMIRTDLAEKWVANGEALGKEGVVGSELLENGEVLKNGDLRVLEDLRGNPEGPEPNFPFPYSTRLAAPEWSLAYLPWAADGDRWEIMRSVRWREPFLGMVLRNSHGFSNEIDSRESESDSQAFLMLCESPFHRRFLCGVGTVHL